MSNPISTRCPKCKTVLKLKNSSAVGKKVPCPKCQHSFVVKPLAKKSKPAPAAEDDFLSGLNEIEDDYGDAALPPKPSRNRSSKKSSKRRKAQPSIWKNPGVIIGSSVVGVLLIVGVVLLASGVFSSEAPAEGDKTEIADADEENVNKDKQSANKGKQQGKRRGAKQGATQTAQRTVNQVNHAWLPDDTELIVSIRVADIWNTPLIQSLIQDPETQQGIAQIRESIGLDPGDIESITIGAAKIAETAKSIQSALPVPGMMPGSAPDLDDLSGVFVIRTSKPVDIQKILSLSDETIAEEIQKVRHNGKEYYRGPDINSEKTQFLGMYFADAKTIVFGPEAFVKTAIESNGRTGDSSRFAFADAGQHILIAFVPSDIAIFNESLTADSFEDSSPASKKLAEAMEGKLRGVAFGLTLNEGLSLQLNTNMQDSQAAKKVSTAISDMVQEGLTGLAEAESTVPPNFKKYISIAANVLKAANTTSNNAIAQLDIAIPPSSLLTIKENLQENIMASRFSGLAEGSGSIDGDSGTFGVPSTEKKPAKPIKAVDLEEFNKSWQIDINITNQPAGDVLKKLAGEMSLTPQSERRQNATLAKKVTLNLQKKSRLEAVEEICRQIGVHPIYESKTEFTNTGDWVTKETIRMQPGPRLYPIQFAGPFLIAVTGLQENAPNPTGRVSLQIIATNLPVSVVSRFRNNHMGPANVAAVLGPQGQPLKDIGRGQIITGFGEETQTENFIQTVAIPLKNLLRGVTTIKTISGQVTFDVPTEIKTLKLDKLTQGAVKKDGGLLLTLKTIQLEDEDSSIQFELSGVGDDFDSDNVIVELRDSKAKLLEVFGSGPFGFGDKKMFDYQVEGKPASLTLKIITQLADMRHDFAFNDIPLTSYAKMPMKITPAKFPGHNAPASLEFVKISGKDNFRKVQFNVVNHSDKGIDSIDITLVYLDAGGKKLKDFPSSYSSPTQFGPDGKQARDPTVKKKGTKQIELTAFFMPKETKTVKAELRKVRFVDAQTWKADSSN